MTSPARNGNSRWGDVGGLKQKCPACGGRGGIFWNYTLGAQDFYVPTLHKKFFERSAEGEVNATKLNLQSFENTIIDC